MAHSHSSPLVQMLPPGVKPNDDLPRASSAEGEELLLEVQGMTCASCVSHVQKALSSVPGVNEARVNLVTEQASVHFDPKQATADQFVQAIERAGYSAKPAEPAHHAQVADGDRSLREMNTWLWRLIAGIFILTPMIAIHFLAQSHVWNWAQFALATAMQIVVGWPYLVNALKRLKYGAANMDSLIELGSMAAYVAGIFALAMNRHDMYFMDSALILEFVTLGKYLEARAKRRASLSIRKLLDLTPQEARVVHNGETVVVPVAEVRSGETIVIRPGDRVPLDAKILEGMSSVDQAWLTGESIPVDKQVGDDVLAGAINGAGSLTAQVTKAAGETALSRVIDLVRRAQESKAQAQRVADKIVSWFVPAVAVVATLTLLAWGLIGSNWDMGFQSAVAVIVVACPCALGLATPTAILVASGRGAEMGILVKEAQALETAGKLTTVVLDKTGTITAGKPKVTDVVALQGDESQLVALAAAAERLSSHPLADPIVAEAAKRNAAIPTAGDLQVVSGGGVVASVEGKRVLVGNKRLLAQFQVDSGPAEAVADKLRAQGKTPLFVAENDALLGVIALADVVAPHSREGVERIKGLGLRVLLISGDAEATVRAVAQEVGITEVEAEVLPERKRNVVARLQAEGETVAMVGDGINDAPALAAANLGIAIGTGADVAIETADVVIAGNDLRKVSDAVLLARATLRTIHQNLGWAFIYNMVLLPMAAGVFVPFGGPHLPPIAAAAAMSLSSVSVVLNSLLLKRRVPTSK
jgi:P-type Cu+ transporter